MKHHLAFVLAIGLSAQAHAAERFHVLVCYPGGGNIDARQAQPAMQKMLGVIETLGGWPSGTFGSSFTSSVDECLKLLANKPALMIGSLGIFLEQREAHHLIPLAQPKVEGSTTEVFRLLVKKGGPSSLEALRGKTLGGPLLDEPEFLRRVVFEGKLDPRTHFKLEPTRQALRALRSLSQGKLDAVLVNAQQFRALNSLPFATDFEAVFVSRELPQVGLAADELKTSADERKRLQAALSELCADGRGKEVCEMFGVDAFVPTELVAYRSVLQLWNGK